MRAPLHLVVLPPIFFWLLLLLPPLAKALRLADERGDHAVDSEVPRALASVPLASAEAERNVEAAVGVPGPKPTEDAPGGVPPEDSQQDPGESGKGNVTSRIAKNACRGPVAVVGAGLAGLTAARSLHLAGCRVTVFEAKNYVGGRTKTAGDGPFRGVEIGAHWIHGGKGNLVLAPLLEYFKLPLQRVGGDQYFEGDVNKFTVFEKSEKMPRKDTKEMVSWFHERMDDLAGSKLDTEATAAEAWAEERPKKLTPEQKWVLPMGFGLDYGDDMRKMGGRVLADDHNAFEGADAIIPGGMKQLVASLAYGLDVNWEAPVTLIEDRGEGGVALHSHDGKVKEFHSVVVTASLGALHRKDISFKPELTSEKQESLQRLGMVHQTKILLKLADGAAPLDMLLPALEQPWNSWPSLPSTPWRRCVGRLSSRMTRRA
eukprot:TRINITY_DN28902_c0_g1_i2.p1 TRINITY_DN28902_c0_g1~~TRINITY_DN28902_c0_g1_i2.p1  ORF type:complete len:430 (+),score=118.85 TRINITY_DN28902_c0_g1_i2:119-1408(+)